MKETALIRGCLLVLIRGTMLIVVIYLTLGWDGMGRGVVSD